MRHSYADLTRGEARVRNDEQQCCEPGAREMTRVATAQISRRVFLGAGSLVVTFSLVPRALAQLAGGGEGSDGPAIVAPSLVADLRSYPFLDAWIRIDADGITVFTGKAELGQGIRTALSQVAAEELDVPFEFINLVTADTRRTP